jgi:parvulin-like peptidyl-prolyl isomerase
MSRLTILLAVLLLCGCQDDAQTDLDPAPPTQAARSIPADAPADAVAGFRDGFITVDDVDARILATPADDRPAPGSDLDGWYREQIRLLAMNRLLLAEARRTDLDQDHEFVLRRLALERQIGIRQCLAAELPDAIRVDPAAVNALYEERADDLSAPERRSVYHLYRRLGDDADVDALDAELTTLRDRVLAGERFETLATEYSDSESRHREGSLGWFTPGQLPPTFDEVVFALDEGVPSQPVHMGDGAHLFLVGDVLPERQIELSEAAPRLRQELLAEQEAAALDELAARNDSPTVRIVERDELERIGRDDEIEAIVLEASDYALSLKDFRTRLARAYGDAIRQAPGARSAIPADQAWDALERLKRHEAAFEYCRASDRIDPDTIARQLEGWIEQSMTARMRQSLLRELALSDPQALESFFLSNRDQFLPPVEWQVDRLRIPFSGAAEGDALMARLEQLAAEDASSLTEIQDELGGDIDRLDGITMLDMQNLNPKMGQRVASTPTGSLVPPLRIDDRLELFRVVDRRQPAPPELADVQDAVVSAYLRQYTAELYTRLEADWLAESGYVLFEPRLALLRRAGRAETEISIEELDALLDGS